MNGGPGAEQLRSIVAEQLDKATRATDWVQRAATIPNFVEHVSDQLESNLRAERWHAFDLLLRIAYKHPSPLYTDTLCKALHLQSNQVNSDDIIITLSEIRDPRAVPELRNCAWWRPYWEIDPHLGRKCLYALRQIGDQAAVEAILEVAVSGPSDLRDDYALPDLARLNYPPERQLRAQYDATTITVYQAYRPEIADAAVRAQRLVAPFSTNRMTWIKPSFLWMMYRSGWASKPDQERVLAIRMAREPFEAALAGATPSTFDPSRYADVEQWRAATAASPIRIQWDPDRAVDLERLPWRCIQIGLGPRITTAYARQWITGIEDVTPLAQAVKRDIDRDDHDAAHTRLPVERPYPLPLAAATAVGAAQIEPRS